MSQKKLDRQNRFRSKTVGFRLSPEESFILDKKVELSGLTKQEYLIHCIENRDYVIEGKSTRVYKVLKHELIEFENILKETKELEALSLDDIEIFEYVLQIIIAIKHKKRAEIKVEMEPLP